MDNIQLNAELWGAYYDWAGAGEEWSDMWGGSLAQWLGSIYPRISTFLPTESILEIAPGYGRWTQYLLSASKQYQGVDLSQVCVEACKKRFAGVKHASFSTNNGVSLKFASDSSVDFVFSFDSLVHASADVMSAYVKEIVRILKDDGAAFIHHSNWLEVGEGLENSHGRGSDVSATLVRQSIEQAGGAVLIQEKINWGHAECSDCLTIFSKERTSDPMILENREFMAEGNNIRKYQSPYSNLAKSRAAR